MANEKDFYAFPTGQSGLTPAVIPTGQGLDVQPLMTAIQQRMLNKYRGDQITLDLQKMAQDARHQDAQLQLERDKLAAEADLRAAQTDNYYAQAEYHRAAAKQENSGAKTKWEYEASQVPVLSDWERAVKSIDADVGTQDWWNQRKALDIDPKYAGALATDIGRRAMTHIDSLAGQASTRIATDQKTAKAQLDTNAIRYAVPMEAFGSLQDDITNDTENVWRRRADGARFAYFPRDDPKAGPVKASEVTEDNKDSLRPVTIFKPQWQSILALQKKVAPIEQRQVDVPPQYYQQQQGQPAPVFDYDPSNQTYTPYGGGGGGTP